MAPLAVGRGECAGAAWQSDGQCRETRRRHVACFVQISGNAEQVNFQVPNQVAPLNDASLQELFEPFKPESDVESSRDGGMGPQPCIARQIANAHGGGINAQSKNGEMVFAVQLPLASGCWTLDASPGCSFAIKK